jgi:hypothetical protein
MDFSLLNATDAAVWFLEKKKKNFPNTENQGVYFSCEFNSLIFISSSIKII